MKKITLFFVAFIALSVTMYAQPGGGGFQRRTVEERVASIHAKLDSAFKLESTKMAAIDTALTVLYKAQDAKRQEFMAGGTMPDRETMMAEMKKYTDAQDEILKAVLTKDEYAIWKETIEPSMRRGRNGGGGPRNQ